MRNQNQLKRKQIVFIDKQVPDYEKLAKSFRKNVEIHFIETNEDGFKKIEQTLESGKKYSAIHIIGHGSAGQILFGNALLTNENIENYKSTLSNIGESLTKKGDILFYGCNIAANESGEALLKKISNFTKADIAASNDLTGKGGDWVLENRYGIVETKNAEVIDYEHFLAYGVSSVSGQGVEKHDATSFWPTGQKDSQKRIMITLEKENISSANVSTIDPSRRTSSYFSNVSSSNKINSYLVYLNDNTGDTFKTATFNFEGEILGWYFESKRTIGNTWSKGGNTYNNADFAKTGASYPNNKHTSVAQGGREIEANQNDTVTISNNNKSLTMRATNGNPGDFIRVITKTPEANTAPVARDVTIAVNENSISSQGDIVAPSDDADGDTLHVSTITYKNIYDQSTTQNMVANTTYALYTKYGLLNINSSNALLKNLEEPNENVFFILIFNSEKFLIDTIKSRCIEFKLSLSNENTRLIVNNYFNENIYEQINSNLINYYSTPFFLISLINYMNEFELSVSETTVDDLLVNLINNKHYIKQEFIRDNLNMIIELFFYKHINTTKKLSYKVKEYYYSKLSNVKKFNLDYETFFLEFKDKLLSE